MARIIFSGANLLDGDNPAQAGMNVAVEGETIAQVSEAPIAAGPEDRMIEMRGRTLMPGLICSHFHASYNGITISPSRGGGGAAGELSGAGGGEQFAKRAARGSHGGGFGGGQHGQH